MNAQVHCNIISKALGTQCYGSQEEIINNFPGYVRKACFIWMFKNEKEILCRKKKKKKWRKAVKAKGAVCITKLQNYTGSQNVYRTGRLTWTG